MCVSRYTNYGRHVEVHVGPGNGTQVVMFGSKLLYPLSRLTIPKKYFFRVLFQLLMFKGDRRDWTFWDNAGLVIFQYTLVSLRARSLVLRWTQLSHLDPPPPPWHFSAPQVLIAGTESKDSAIR